MSNKKINITATLDGLQGLNELLDRLRPVGVNSLWEMLAVAATEKGVSVLAQAVCSSEEDMTAIITALRSLFTGDELVATDVPEDALGEMGCLEDYDNEDQEDVGRS